MSAERLLALALLALDDPRALPVLGDAILESGWFDKRVMQVMLPIVPVGRVASPKQRERARRLRAEFRAGYPEAFHTFVTQDTIGLTRQRWARAVAAVLLFGAWSKKRWVGVPHAWRTVYNTTVTFDGVSIGDVLSLTYSPSARSKLR